MAQEPEVRHVAEIGCDQSLEVRLPVAGVGRQHRQAEALLRGRDQDLEGIERAPDRQIREARRRDHLLGDPARIVAEPSTLAAARTRIEPRAMGAGDVAADRDRRELPADQLFGRRRRRQEGAHGDVRLALAEVEVLRVDLEREIDRRVRRAERRQAADQEACDVRVGARDPDRPFEARVLSHQTAFERGDLPFDPLGARDHVVAGQREQVSVAVAIEEAHAESRLERLDPARDRRMAHPESGAGGSDGPSAGEREEVSKVVPIHATVELGAAARSRLDAVETRGRRG